MVLDEAASMALLDEMHRLQALRVFQKAGDDALVEALLPVRCNAQRVIHPIAETQALRLSNFSDMINSILCCDASFIAIAKTEIKFIAAPEEEHGVYFLATWMVGIVNYMVSSDFLTHNSPQTYQQYIRVARFLHQRPNIFNIIGDNDEE